MFSIKSFYKTDSERIKLFDTVHNKHLPVNHVDIDVHMQKQD